MCEEKELLVAFLYDDLSDRDRVAFESHLRGCAECRGELKALRTVRADLASWSPPQPDFGFRVVRGGRDASERDAVRPPGPSWRAWWTPAAGLAAAAVLVLAAASAMAHVEIHRGADGITVRTGWSSVAAADAPRRAEAAQDVRLASDQAAVDVGLIAALDRRLRALEASPHDGGLRSASMLSARADTDLIKRVRDLVAQSENRQQGELALRISQVIHDFDAQRQADLAKIQQGLGRIDASVATEAAAHRDLTNYILASAKK